MIYLILALISLGLTLSGLRRAGGDPARLKSLLLMGGIGFVGGKLLSTGVLGPGGPLGMPSHGGVIGDAFAFMLWGSTGVVLATAVFRLVSYRARGYELAWMLPFVLLSLAASSWVGTHPLFAALLALPALAWTRWRQDLSDSALALTSLLSLLLGLLHVLGLQVHTPIAPESPIVVGAVRFAQWAQTIAVLYILCFLPALVWGMNVQIRSVRLRLLVSHLLTGLVPILLVGIFWALSTYLSVNVERAQSAVRHLREESRELALSLSRAASAEGDEPLLHWAHACGSSYPGLRILRIRTASTDPTLTVEGSEWELLAGDPIAQAHAVGSWPDSLDQGGVVLLAGERFLGARAMRTAADGVREAIIALTPIEAIIGQTLVRRLGAEVMLDTRVIPEAEGGIPPGGRPPTRARDGSPSQAVAAAMVPSIEWNGVSWESRSILVWTRVGFFSAIRGMTAGVQENPYNLIPLAILAAVGLLFFLVEFVTLGMVVSIARSITRALHALTRGTARLREGNLRYRIPVEGRDDLWDVAENFNRMAIELERARELEIEKERLESELGLARQIQARLLPSDVPAVPRTELAGYSLPARQVGGDYYDFLPIRDGRIGLIVADVSGKGVPAALLMSSLRAALLSQKLEEDGPAEVMSALNRFVHRSVEPGRFVTAFLGVLDPATGRFVYGSAGHNPPYWVRPDGRVTPLREGGLVLGLFPETPYSETTIEVAPGDLLALFTDGVTEAQNEFDEFWGEDRLIRLLRTHPAKSCRRLLTEILDDVRNFSGDQGQTDDITLLLARWSGPSA